jgi:uncharacterized membrane protein
MRSTAVGYEHLHELILAGALFLIAHLGISSTPLRGVLVRTIGENPYRGAYSILAVVTLVYLILTYNRTPIFYGRRRHRIAGRRC